MKEDKKAYTGIGFTGLLTIAFIVLKLCGVITWPWIWVLCPLWIPLAIAAIIVGIALCVAACRSDKDERKKGRWY